MGGIDRGHRDPGDIVIGVADIVEAVAGRRVEIDQLGHRGTDRAGRRRRILILCGQFHKRIGENRRIIDRDGDALRRAESAGAAALAVTRRAVVQGITKRHRGRGRAGRVGVGEVPQHVVDEGPRRDRGGAVELDVECAGRRECDVGEYLPASEQVAAADGEQRSGRVEAELVLGGRARGYAVDAEHRPRIIAEPAIIGVEVGIGDGHRRVDPHRDLLVRDERSARRERWAVVDRADDEADGVGRRGEGRRAAVRAHIDESARDAAGLVPGTEGECGRDRAVEVRRRLVIDPGIGVGRKQQRIEGRGEEQKRPGAAAVQRIIQDAIVDIDGGDRNADQRTAVRLADIVLPAHRRIEVHQTGNQYAGAKAAVLVHARHHDGRVDKHRRVMERIDRDGDALRRAESAGAAALAVTRRAVVQGITKRHRGRGRAGRVGVGEVPQHVVDEGPRRDRGGAVELDVECAGRRECDVGEYLPASEQVAAADGEQRSGRVEAELVLGGRARGYAVDAEHRPRIIAEPAIIGVEVGIGDGHRRVDPHRDLLVRDERSARRERWAVVDRADDEADGVGRRGEGRRAAVRAHIDESARDAAGLVPGTEGECGRDRAVEVRRRLVIDPGIGVGRKQQRIEGRGEEQKRPGAAAVQRII